MMKPLRKFEAHIQFNALGMVVKARTESEAKKKIIARLKKMPASRFLDKRNFYINDVTL